jgi:hypothetical protein
MPDSIGIKGDFGPYGALLRHIFQKPEMLSLVNIYKIFNLFLPFEKILNSFGIHQQPYP